MDLRPLTGEEIALRARTEPAAFEVPNRASQAGGVCTQENGQGPGPATVALVHAAPGTYRVGAHLHRGTRSVVTFVTLLHEGTPKEGRREDILVLQEAGLVPRFIREVVIP